MGQFTSDVTRIFGGAPAGDQQANQGMASPQNQNIPEQLVVGTTRRMAQGPSKTGSFTIHVLNDVVSGATSTLTAFVSNLPNPSLASDADWVALTGFTSVDLTALGGTISIQKEVLVGWVMIKVVTVTTAGSLRVFYLPEGMRV